MNKEEHYLETPVYTEEKLDSIKKGWLKKHDPGFLVPEPFLRVAPPNVIQGIPMGNVRNSAIIPTIPKKRQDPLDQNSQDYLGPALPPNQGGPGGPGLDGAQGPPPGPPLAEPQNIARDPPQDPPQGAREAVQEQAAAREAMQTPEAIQEIQQTGPSMMRQAIQYGIAGLATLGTAAAAAANNRIVDVFQNARTFDDRLEDLLRSNFQSGRAAIEEFSSTNRAAQEKIFATNRESVDTLLREYDAAMLEKNAARANKILADFNSQQGTSITWGKIPALRQNYALINEYRDNMDPRILLNSDFDAVRQLANNIQIDRNEVQPSTSGYRPIETLNELTSLLTTTDKENSKSSPQDILKPDATGQIILKNAVKVIETQGSNASTESVLNNIDDVNLENAVGDSIVEETNDQQPITSIISVRENNQLTTINSNEMITTNINNWLRELEETMDDAINDPFNIQSYFERVNQQVAKITAYAQNARDEHRQILADWYDNNDELVNKFANLVDPISKPPLLPDGSSGSILTSDNENNNQLSDIGYPLQELSDQIKQSPNTIQTNPTQPTLNNEENFRDDTIVQDVNDRKKIPLKKGWKTENFKGFSISYPANQDPYVIQLFDNIYDHLATQFGSIANTNVNFKQTSFGAKYSKII